MIKFRHTRSGVPDDVLCAKPSAVESLLALKCLTYVRRVCYTLDFNHVLAGVERVHPEENPLLRMDQVVEAFGFPIIVIDVNMYHAFNIYRHFLSLQSFRIVDLASKVFYRVEAFFVVEIRQSVHLLHT